MLEPVFRNRRNRQTEKPISREWIHEKVISVSRHLYSCLARTNATR